MMDGQELIQALLRDAGLPTEPENPIVTSEEQWEEIEERLLQAAEEDAKKWLRVKQESWIAAQTMILD